MAATNIQTFAGQVEVTSNLTVDTNTLHVDSVAGRVGIGKTDPAYAMDVNGTVNATALYVGGSEFTGGGFDPDVNEIAIGTNAGALGQGSYSVAVGWQAGNLFQGSNATAVGRAAGQDYQGSQAVAMGYAAGYNGQGANSVAVGVTAGESNQSSQATAVGVNAGQSAQGFATVAIGNRSARYNQGSSAVAVGDSAGHTAQGSSAVAVGDSAAYTSQGSYAVAVGGDAGQISQSSRAVAIGYQAGQTRQSQNALAIGYQAAQTSQKSGGVAVGWAAGQYSQTAHAVAIGSFAGNNSQGLNAVSIAQVAGQLTQGTGGVAVGYHSARYNQGNYAVAVGPYAGNGAQGSRSIAVGITAGYNNQGHDAIALGINGGLHNQPSNTFYIGTTCIRNANGNEYVHYNNSTGEFVRGNAYSDDRLKYNEKVITGAIKSLFKLRPEEYDKKPSLKPSHTGQNWKRESGLIAQEIFYNAPEFRHIVQVPQTAGDVEKYTPPPSDDPNQDPDYSVWGEDSPSVDYKQFVPYLIKAVQEIVTELPRSKTTVSNAWGQNITGLVVSANANAHKTNTTPIVALSNVYMDKKWYGVVSNKTTDTNDYDTLVDTKGDTQIWVTDTGGSLESGDLVTTSNVAPGYTQKQVDGVLMNYTVAKVTQDCDFTEPTQRPIRVPKRELSNVTYYLRVTEQDINIDEYEKLFDTQRKIKTTPVYVKEVGENEGGEEQFFRGETRVSEEKYKTLPEDERSKKWVIELEVAEYEKLTDEEKAEYTLGTRERWFVLTTTKSKAPIPEHNEEVVVEELVDVLNENGQIVWEETDETEPVYTLVDHGSYKAALVSAKLI